MRAGLLGILILTSIGAAGPAAAATFSERSDWISTSDLTQTGRPFSKATGDTCASPGQAGPITAGSFHYTLDLYTNRSNETICVSAILTATGCFADEISSAGYVPLFDPANVAASFAGSGAGSYSFRVPPKSQFAVNVHATAEGSGCAGFDLRLDSDLPFVLSPPAIESREAPLQVGLPVKAKAGQWAGADRIGRQWQRCRGITRCTDISGATGASYTPTAQDGGHYLRLREIAVGQGRSATADSQTTRNAVPRVYTPRPRGKDLFPPRLVRVGISHPFFRVARQPTALRAFATRIARGTTFTFDSSETGRTTITIERPAWGRFVRGRCSKKAKRRGRRCRRYDRVGTLVRRAALRGNAVPFSGRLGRRPLRPGRYRAWIRVTDRAGNRSKPAKVRFRIARG